MSAKEKRDNEKKIDIYSNLFIARSDVYGTYNPVNGRVFQKKEPVTRQVILDHLLGKRPYGMYMLMEDRTNVLVIDFDDHDKNPVIEFIHRASHYNISAYIEKSKSKGWHTWVFFNKGGVTAAKARTVADQILGDIEAFDTEFFPKQNAINTKNGLNFGNFINAPMFGRLVPEGKTLFYDPISFQPYKNQWTFLETVRLVTEKELDDLIEINDWELIDQEERIALEEIPCKPKTVKKHQSLLPCAKKMMFGVQKNQRLISFRLAIHLKNLGFPYEITIWLLKFWAKHNRPTGGKSIIKEKEIISQVRYAYKKRYSSYGCGQTETLPFCTEDCPLYKKNRTK